MASYCLKTQWFRDASEEAKNRSSHCCATKWVQQLELNLILLIPIIGGGFMSSDCDAFGLCITRAVGGHRSDLNRRVRWWRRSGSTALAALILPSGADEQLHVKHAGPAPSLWQASAAVRGSAKAHQAASTLARCQSAKGPGQQRMVPSYPGRAYYSRNAAPEV